MEPAYHHLQFVLVDRRPGSFARGDVIVFRKEGIRGLLIKRVAACPGDRLRISDGILYVNDKAVQRSILIADAGRAEDNLTSGQYYVLGDNANHSIDSRFAEVGIVTADEIVGRVVFPISGG